MMSHIKRFMFYALGSIAEVMLLPALIFILIFTRFFFKAKRRSIFMGMMHINNWTYVAKALRKKGYYVQVIPWMIPEHEVGVIPYDINLKNKHPLLYSNFIGLYVLQYWMLVWSVAKFKIFITPFKSRILDRTVWLKYLEIPLLHLAGKKVILNTYGGDVATPRLRRRKDLKYSLYDGYRDDPHYRAYDEKAIARNTRVLERQADCVISAIDHVDYLDRVDHYFHLRCIDTQTIAPHYEVNNPIPVFVHAPNHRMIKGTDKIIQVIDSLNQQGFKCVLKIIENTPNDQLLEIIKESDAVIDQLLLGTYARLSIEAMALGKPVFCHLRKDLYQFNPIWKHCPIIDVNPDTLEACLKDFLRQSKKARSQVGVEGRKYIEKFHSLETVGERCSKIIREVVGA